MEVVYFLKYLRVGLIPVSMLALEAPQVGMLSKALLNCTAFSAKAVMFGATT
jgi:hypothetical protein